MGKCIPINHSLLKPLLGIIAIGLLLESSAQTQMQSASKPATNSETGIIACVVYVTIVRVQVRSHRGKEISDLGKDDFIVYEDGVRQTIVIWTRDGDSAREGIQPGYTMAYYPLKYPFDGKFRRIRVTVSAKGKRDVRVQSSPRGYYARKELLR